MNLDTRFKDGIYFVDLAPVREPESFLTSIARTIGLKETSDQPLLDELGKQLHEKKLLLLLDNFEQLTSASPLVVELLGHCPHLRLLVTSREALHIRGEQVFPVSPLALPDVDFKKLPREEAMRFESIQLFMERASAVRPDFGITDENAPVIAGICSRLDGLPLAIELAAARISLFSPQDLLRRLDNRLKLLRGGARDLPSRQQTLEDTIDWSYELLDDTEKQLFTLFSVFQSCTIGDVEAVAAEIMQTGKSNRDVIDVLSSLVDKSLIRRSEQDTGKQRLHMLETIREYASERLSGDTEFHATARRKHAEYYAGFSKRQWQRLTGNEREAALREIETDIENVRLAWQYWVAESDLEQLQKLTDSLWLLFHAKGWFSAIVELTTDLLKVLSSVPSSPERAEQEIMLQTSLGRVMMALKGCTPEVEEVYKHALQLCKKYGEIPRSFLILRALASFYVYVGNMEECRVFGEQILSLADQLSDDGMRIEAYLLFGYTTAFTGDILKGLDYLHKAISLYKPGTDGSQSFRFGNNSGIICRTTSAICYWMIGYPATSLKYSEEAFALAEKLDHPSSKLYALFHIGLLHHYRREDEAVLKYTETAMDLAEKLDFPIWRAVVSCLHGAALSETGRIEEGLAEFNLGLEMYAELKTPPVFWPLLLMIKAGVYIRAEKFRESLDIVDETFNIIGKFPGNPMLSELYRLKGDVLLMVSPDEYIEPENLFKQALQIARKHRTATFELRAAISLSRMWIRQNKGKESRQFLKAVCDKFTEDFETVELKEAKEILSGSSKTISN